MHLATDFQKKTQSTLCNNLSIQYIWVPTDEPHPARTEEPRAHRYLCSVLILFTAAANQMQFPMRLPNVNTNLASELPFWPFLNCSVCLRQAPPLPPCFPLSTHLAHFHLPFSQFNQVCFQAAGGSLVHTCILHILRLLSQVRRSSSLAPPEPSQGLELTQEGVCACVKGRESTDELRLHPRQNSYSLPEASGFACLRNSRL